MPVPVTEAEVYMIDDLDSVGEGSRLVIIVLEECAGSPCSWYREASEPETA